MVKQERIFFLDNDNKNSGLDSSTHESNRSHQVNVKRNRKTKKKNNNFFAFDFWQNSEQPILLDCDDDTNSDPVNSDMPEKRRDSSIKKILSNQPLEKAEYVGKTSFIESLFVFIESLEINQKVQNSASNSTKPQANNELANLERSNSLSGRMFSKQNKRDFEE